MQVVPAAAVTMATMTEQIHQTNSRVRLHSALRYFPTVGVFRNIWPVRTHGTGTLYVRSANMAAAIAAR